MISEQDLQNYEAFMTGDVGSFEFLVKKYRDSLVSFLYRYIKDIHLAQDLAQDVFVEVLVHKERYDRKLSFKTYLFTIGRNKAVDYIRKNKKYYLVHEVSEFTEPVRGLEDMILQDEQKKRLYRAMDGLKLEYQAAISLIDLEDMTYQEAANVMGKTLGQMKVLVHRARKSLAKIMEKEGDLFE